MSFKSIVKERTKDEDDQKSSPCHYVTDELKN